MKEIALHIMDIVQNSITAHADLIAVGMVVDPEADTLAVTITDNGTGMDEDMLSRVTSPFTTTRTTRKVGLGIPLLKAGAESTGGSFSITSRLGEGTTVSAVYGLKHLDRPPIGDLAGVYHTLVICNTAIDFEFMAELTEKFVFSTREIKEKLDGVPLTTPEVSLWLMEYLKEGIDEIFGGKFE